MVTSIIKKKLSGDYIHQYIDQNPLPCDPSDCEKRQAAEEICRLPLFMVQFGI